MKKLFIAIVICSQCMSGYVIAQNIVEGNFIHGGINRTYRLYIPAIYNPSTAVPLVLNLHGYGSNNIQQELYGDFRGIADTAGFIIAHPNGTIDLTSNRFWNTFGNSTVDDIGFISALIDTIQVHYNIDSNHIFSTGMSNGGFMSYELACFLSNRIAAIASVTGSVIYARFGTCSPLHPMPVMQVHGTADATVPFNGNTYFAGIDELISYWTANNDCFNVPEIIDIPDIDPNDGCTAKQYIYGDGLNGSTVELFKVFGGGHSWPGAPININITNMDFSASAEIWRFFRQYSLNSLVGGVNEPSSLSSGFYLFPNPSVGQFTIAFTDESPKQITITNMLGQIVYNHPCSGRSALITLAKKGVLLVTVKKNGNRNGGRKVVVY